MISNQFLYQSHLQGELDRWNRDMSHFQEEVDRMKREKAPQERRFELDEIDSKMKGLRSSMENESHEGWEAFKDRIDRGLREVRERLSRLSSGD